MVLTLNIINVNLDRGNLIEDPHYLCCLSATSFVIYFILLRIYLKNTKLPYDAAFPLLGVYPKGSKTGTKTYSECSL